jgi:hypothetical protein
MSRVVNSFFVFVKIEFAKKYDSIFFLVFFFTVFVLVPLLENNLSDGFVEIVA